MAIVFPASPSNNDTFTVGSITYTYDGSKWIGLGVTPTDRLIEGSNSLEINASNNLVWTGGYVGIDTTTDSAFNLNATDDGPIYSAFQRSGTRIGYYGFGGSGNTFSIVNEATSGNFNITTPSSFSITTNSTEKLRIDSSGLITTGGTTASNHGSPNLLLWGADTTLHLTSTGSVNNSSFTGIKFAVAGGSTGDYSKAGIFVQRQDSYNDLDMIFAFRSTNDAAGVAISDEKLRITSDGTLLVGNNTATITEAKIEAYSDNTGNADVLCLYNKDATTGNTANILFAPANSVAGARIICEAMEDFTTSANRTADLSFVTRQDGTLAEAARMSSAGYFTVPRQPSFRAGLITNYIPGSLTNIVFDITSQTYHHNNGGHYSTSNGRFTAPVAGMYTFSASVIWQSLTTGQAMDDAFQIQVNGNLAGYSWRRSEYVDGTTGNAGYYLDFGSYDIYLEANEYVTIRNRFANVQVHGNAYYTTFSGCLIA